MNLTKFLKVYSKFLHTSLASELEYKTNILIDLITAILSLIGSIFLLSIFFQSNGSIGGWEFKPEGSQTRVRYTICTDSGGSVPRGVQNMATKTTLPDTVGDLIRESLKRSK